MNEKNTVLISEFDEQREKDFEEAQILSESKAEILPESDEKTKEMSAVLELLSNLDTEIEVSIIVTRLNDKQFKGQFRSPCTVDSQVEVLAWDCQPFPDNHYEYIRKTYGGGCYRFQLRYNDGTMNGFKQAWRVVLSDPAELSEKEKLLKAENEPIKAEIPQPQSFAQTQIFDQKPKSQQEWLREFIEQKQLEKQFIELLVPPSPQPQEIEQKTERTPNKLDFLTEIYRETKEEGVKHKIVNSLLGVSDPKSEVVKRSWLETIADTFAASPTLQNKASQVMESIIGLATVAITPKPPIQPPAEAPPITLDSFRANPNPSPTDSPPENEPHATETENEPLVIESPFQFIPIGAKNDD